MSSSLERFLEDPDSPKLLIGRQASPHQYGDAPESSDQNAPQRLPQKSAREPKGSSTGHSLRLSDQGSESESCKSILSRESFSGPSDVDTGTIPSSYPGVGSLDIVRRRVRELPCIFRDILQCPVSFRLTSDNRIHWYSHCRAHFQHALPRNTLCIFCNTIFFGEDPQRSWDERIEHIGDHFENGWTIEHSRPDFQLLKFMRHNGMLSEREYEDHIAYTERPPVEGLRPLDFVTEEKRQRERMRAERENTIIIDQQKEDRERRKLVQSRKIRTKQEGSRRNRSRRTSAIKIRAPKPSTKESHPLLREHQPSADQNTLTSPRVQWTTRVPKGSIEASRFISDPSSLLTSSNDSDTDLSDSSEDSTTSVHGQTLCKASLAARPDNSLRPDLDADDDLINPAQYRQRLKNIQNAVFENSVALLIERHNRCIDYLEMFQCIQENISILQRAGFCQGKLSFLAADPTRLDVALLISIPVDYILSLGSHSTVREAQQPMKPDINPSNSLPPELLKGRINANLDSSGGVAIDRRLLNATLSIDEHEAKTSSGSNKAVSKPPSGSTYSRSITGSRSSFASSDRSSTFPTSHSEYDAHSIFSKDAYSRQTFLRVPDQCLCMFPI
jgi:hypothetical protein